MNWLTLASTFHLEHEAPPLLGLLVGLLLFCVAAQLLLASFGHNQAAGRLRTAFATTALVAALTALLLDSTAALSIRWSLPGMATPHALSVGVFVSRISSAMVALVAFLGWVVLGYAQTYLRSEKSGATFLQRMAWAIILVQLFALSSHLIEHALLWVGISVLVHRLLRHYDERLRARVAARKKFLFSRVADLIFWSSLLVIYLEVGTLDIQELSAPELVTLIPSYAMVGICAAVLLKSAQFPFQSWLPETMDAPTPVSALMHAGVVNAGAFLLLQLSPLLAASSEALLLLTLIGGLTAAFGTVCGAVQPSVKLRLAYSTVAQMGFLFFELGLGFASAAALHLVAHAVYKAHAFLRSGTRAVRPVRTNAGLTTILTAMAVSLLVFSLLVTLGWASFGTASLDYLPMSLVWALGTSQYLLGPAGSPRRSRVTAFAMVGLAVWASCLLAEALLAGWFAPLPGLTDTSLVGATLIGLVLATITVSFVFAEGCSGRSRPLFPRIYSLALTEFQLGNLSDRLMNALHSDLKTADSKISSRPLKAPFFIEASS